MCVLCSGLPLWVMGLLGPALQVKQSGEQPSGLFEVRQRLTYKASSRRSTFFSVGHTHSEQHNRCLLPTL